MYQRFYTFVPNFVTIKINLIMATTLISQIPVEFIYNSLTDFQKENIIIRYEIKERIKNIELKKGNKRDKENTIAHFIAKLSVEFNLSMTTIKKIIYDGKN